MTERDKWRLETRAGKDALTKEEEFHRSDWTAKSDKIWKQSLEDDLLRVVNQHKADTTISKLQHKEKLKSWKQGL